MELRKRNQLSKTEAFERRRFEFQNHGGGGCLINNFEPDMRITMNNIVEDYPDVLEQRQVKKSESWAQTGITKKL